MSKLFERLASVSTRIIGSAGAFIWCIALIIIWGVFGPITHYSDTWQLIANTVSTLITTLIVILIQHSQNKDTKALHLKIDELVKATDKARNELIGIEKKTEKEIENIKEGY